MARRANVITKEQALMLRHGQILHHVSMTNSGKTPMRVRVNGKVKTWKTRPDDFRIPVKYGLYTFGYVEKSVDRDNSGEWEVA